MLTKYAEIHKVDKFVVEKVAPLTREPNPRSKAWKLLMPARLKETMEKAEMYPKGWVGRAFTFYGPRRQEREMRLPSGGPAAGTPTEEQPMQGLQGAAVAAALGEEPTA
jgi:hypothetical protein